MEEMKFKYFFVPLVFISLFFSCKKDKEESYGKIQFNFKFQVNGTTLKTDTIMYTNAAGNPYMINNIQYFLTNICWCSNENGSILTCCWHCCYVNNILNETIPLTSNS